MMLLTPHFTLEEMVRSDFARRAGIDNTPSPVICNRLRLTAERMEDVRTRLGNRAIAISSGYRCSRLNVAIGGAIYSGHVDGWAVDFECKDFGAPFRVARFLSEQTDLEFDQLIYEYGGWTHLSFDPRMRRDVLTIHNKSTGYMAGIVPIPGVDIEGIA